jgi:2-iminobutanoate/2-iminopropanoate deaminase
MAREAIVPEGGARPSGAYSPAVRVGDLIFVSGQGPVDPETGAPPGDDIQSQVRQTLRNIATILAAAGATLGHVVRIDAYLADFADFDAYDAMYREFFTGVLPARTTVQAGLGQIKVEINAIAHVGAVGA